MRRKAKGRGPRHRRRVEDQKLNRLYELESEFSAASGCLKLAKQEGNKEAIAAAQARRESALGALRSFCNKFSIFSKYVRQVSAATPSS